jgi:hypothetical protein
MHIFFSFFSAAALSSAATGVSARGAAACAGEPQGRAAEAVGRTLRQLHQYVYFCTSKVRKLSTCGAA